jgi:SAM-dependent methyltransferase
LDVAAGEVQYWNSVGRCTDHAVADWVWRAHSDAVNSALLSRWLPSEQVSSILKTDVYDEACGSGLIPLLSSRCRQVIGIDISHSTVVAAKHRHPGSMIMAADVRRLPFSDDSFDVAVSNSTLDHFESMDELQTGIRELHRVLRPGGRLILALDNPTNPLVALRNMLPFSWLHRTGLVPYYVGATCGRGRLKRILEGVGFAVQHIDAMLHCPRVFAVRWARRFNGRASSGRFLSTLMSFERLSRWPTRFVTGYYTAVAAVKNSAVPGPP